jgi:hypothetical protein
MPCNGNSSKLSEARVQIGANLRNATLNALYEAPLCIYTADRTPYCPMHDGDEDCGQELEDGVTADVADCSILV